MDKETFSQLLHIYGAEVTRWPAHLQKSAAAAANLYPSLLREALFLDRALDSYQPQAPDAAFLNDIVASAQASINPHWLVVIARKPWLRASVFTACALCGFVFGSFTSEFSPGISTQEAGIESSAGTSQLNEVVL